MTYAVMDRIRRMIAEIESSLNVVVSRVTLKEALEGKLPKIMPRGEPMYISYMDVLELSKVVPEEDRERVLLPITLVRRVDMGSGVFVVPEEDKRAISIILGENREYLSKPEVQEIASRFPSLIHIIILGSDVE